MPRIPLLEESQAKATKEVVEAIRARRGGNFTALDRLLFHSDPVARGWNTMFGSFYKDATLDPRVRELAILRAVSIANVPLEVQAHRAMAVKAGATEADVAAVAEGRTGGFTGRDRAVLEYAEAVTRHVQVPGPTFEALRAHFDDRGILELTFAIAAYNMVARILEPLELRP